MKETNRKDTKKLELIKERNLKVDSISKVSQITQVRKRENYMTKRGFLVKNTDLCQPSDRVGGGKVKSGPGWLVDRVNNLQSNFFSLGFSQMSVDKL